MIVIGRGGHARALGLDTSEAINSDEWPAFFADWRLNTDDDFLNSACEVVVAIGDNTARKRVVEMVETDGAKVVGKHNAALSGYPPAGLQQQPGSMVLLSSQVGAHVILNTGCIVEHDCRVGDFVHIGPGAVLCGTVTVGEGSFVGANVTVLPGRVIGKWATVGAGAVVTKDVPDGETWVGNPARPMRSGADPRALANHLSSSGHTQSSLARELGVSKSMFSRWATGAYNPSLKYATAIERLINLPADWWVDRGGDHVAR